MDIHGHHPGLAMVGYLTPATLSVGTVVLNWYSQNIGVIVGTVALVAYGSYVCSLAGP